VKRTDVGGVDFENMQELSILFSCRPTFSAIMDKVTDKLRWTGDGVDILVQGVIDFGSKGPRIRRLISISGQDEWENYISFVMDSEVRALDLFVRNISREASPNGWPIDMNNSLALVSPMVDDADDDVGPVQVVP
jgi:hypothetical protein